MKQCNFSPMLTNSRKLYEMNTNEMNGGNLKEIMSEKWDINRHYNESETLFNCIQRKWMLQCQFLWAVLFRAVISTLRLCQLVNFIWKKNVNAADKH